MKRFEIDVATAEAMETLGQRLAPAIRAGLVIYFRGELGTGKTTLIRGVMRGLGYAGIVRSPTYTLVEPYALTSFTVYHFDLYRLQTPEELETIGIRDYLSPHGVCLVEWPERGQGVLPSPDAEISIEYKNNSRFVALRCLNQMSAGLCEALQ